MSSLLVLNCFKCFLVYILGHLSQNSKKSFLTISSSHIYFSVSKWQDIHKDVSTISILYVLNYFKYFLIHISRHFAPKKLDKKNFELCQVFMCWVMLDIF